MVVKKRIAPEWWHVDSTGRKIGWLWPDDMLIAIEAIWGRGKGRQEFARYAGLGRSTVEEYCNGKSPVPRHIAALVMALIKLVKKPHGGLDKTSAQFRTSTFPKIEAEWLPDYSENDEIGLVKRPVT